MSHNSFGHLFRVSTWGESHGPAIGCIVDGCPAGIALSTSDIQPYLDARRPGKSRFETQRREPDLVRILSGVFEDQTTGSPISLIIDNKDQRSKDYGEIAKSWRPGHADYTYDVKYGHRDYRGGGRASARETAMRVAAGAVARKLLETAWGTSFHIMAYVTAIGDIAANPDRIDPQSARHAPFFCPDPEILERWEQAIDQARSDQTSLGAIIECVVPNVPPGLGAPVYGKLDQDIAAAMMGINAVKGVEIGAGFEAARLKGHDNADPMRLDDQDNISFLSNHAGGILGGISTGQPIIVRVALKPTPSISRPLQSLDHNRQEIDIATKGRHDPCVGIRAAPIVEAMMSLVLADHFLRMRGQAPIKMPVP